VAIEATVRSANPTILFQMPFELLPRSMNPHVKIVFANPEARGDGVRLRLVQIELPD
jgi:hypothetical protein